MSDDERISEVLPVRSFDEGGYVLLGTRKGVVKKTELESYSNPRRGGIIAINLADDDELIGVARTSGEAEVLVSTRRGKACRWSLPIVAFQKDSRLGVAEPSMTRALERCPRIRARSRAL